MDPGSVMAVWQHSENTVGVRFRNTERDDHFRSLAPAADWVAALWPETRPDAGRL